jgi:signal transduction histidine kinase/DNA-binding response OmpR family regulator
LEVVAILILIGALVIFVAAVIGAAVLVIRSRERKHRAVRGELAAMRRRLHDGLALPAISMFAVGRDGRVTWFAGRGVPDTPLTGSGSLGRPITELLGEWPDWLHAVRAAWSGEHSAVSIEAGEAVLAVTCAPLRDAGARVTEAVVTVRDDTEASREAARAERLAEVRSRALATINHKLRGQLNGMLGMTDLLRTTQLTEQQRGWTETISESGHRLLTFLHQLVAFMELDAERVRFASEPFSLRELVEGVASEHRAQAEADETTLVVRYPLHQPEHFLGDETMLRQAVWLLVGVALRTNAGGEVVVNVEEGERDDESSAIVLTVEDRGRGLSPEALERMFDGLESPSAMWAIRSGGTGLELPIARLIARGMGGELEVESASGAGTTLRVQLTLERAVAPERGEAADDAGDEAAAALSVLLVDDSAVQRRVAVNLLEQLGHEVTTAENGAEALESLDASAFDLVITELHMPVLDGFAVASTVRTRGEADCDVPIIAATSDTRQETRLRALEAGMDAVIEKPLGLEELRAQLRRARRRSGGESAERDESALNDAVIERLRELDPGGRDGLVDELVSAFLTAAPREMLEARDAALALDLERLAPMMRSLELSCRLLGAERLERGCGALVAAVESGDLARARAASNALSSEFVLVRRALLTLDSLAA